MLKRKQVDKKSMYTVEDKVSNRVMISYKTAVAAYIGDTVYVSKLKWSATTKQHIRHFLANFTPVYHREVKQEERPQRWFDSLIKRLDEGNNFVAAVESCDDWYRQGGYSEVIYGGQPKGW